MRQLLSDIIRGRHREREPYVHLLVAYTNDDLADRRGLRDVVRGFPLTWWTVWACVLLSFSLGVLTGFSDPARFSSDIFDGQKALAGFLPGEPMAWWGWLFLALSLLLALASYVTPTAVVVMLRVVGTIYLLTAFLVWGGAAQSGDSASYSGVPLCLFVTVIHLAAASSIRMILRYRFPKGSP